MKLYWKSDEDALERRNYRYGPAAPLFVSEPLTRVTALTSQMTVVWEMGRRRTKFKYNWIPILKLSYEYMHSYVSHLNHRSRR